MAGKQSRSTAKQPAAPPRAVSARAPASQVPLETIEYQWLRFLIGFIAFLFPILLVGGDAYLCDLPLRDSLSRYYDGPMRNVFVGSLTAIGVFLLSYRGESIGQWGFRSEVLRKLDLWIWLNKIVTWVFKPHNLGIIAGFAAIGVAFDPVSCPTVEKVHYFCAMVLFAALARFSWLFGETSKGNWRWFYRALSIVIITMIIWIGCLLYLRKSSILFQEWITVWAFALAWIVVSDKPLVVALAAWNTVLAPYKGGRWLIKKFVRAK